MRWSKKSPANGKMVTEGPMLVLALDTSGQHGSMALARGADEPFRILEVVSLAGRTYSARLIPELSALLARHGLRAADLQGFAAISGPGSFTGLRVGLSSAKALAEILDRPIAAVSMLEALALQASKAARVIAALDADRREIYAGEYDVADGQAALLRESLLSWAQFTALLESNPRAQLITPDAAVIELAAGRMKAERIARPDAGEVARLGFAKIIAGQTIPVETLDANYIRRPDAEILST
jgi:tRNA threonylcarbamoyladenosine biosynthesis protein TsaB